MLRVVDAIDANTKHWQPVYAATVDNRHDVRADGTHCCNFSHDLVTSAKHAVDDRLDGRVEAFHAKVNMPVWFCWAPKSVGSALFSDECNGCPH